jgi:hypothetical protein
MIHTTNTMIERFSIHNGSTPLVHDNQYAAHASKESYKSDCKTRDARHVIQKVANGNDTKPRTRLTFWNVGEA